MAPAAGSRSGRPSHCQPASALSKWKIFDNLRRSLVPSALVLLLLGNWLLLPELGGLGSLLVLVIIALPGVLAALVERDSQAG
jgi:cyclic beta-1,2-glucan synthetase